MGADSESQLGLEARIEVGQGVGVRLVQTVLEAVSTDRLRPVAVHVVIDETQFLDELRQGRATGGWLSHRLQAMRNLSANWWGSRSE